MIVVRRFEPRDLDALATLRAALWPEDAPAAHRGELEALLRGEPVSTLPLTVLVADDGAALRGFVEVGLRSHADGCDPSRPVGYVEGWYVVPAARRSGVGRALIAAAEEWCRARGCREIASDTWIDRDPSIRAHLALGFEVVDRCVNFRKDLGDHGLLPSGG